MYLRAGYGPKEVAKDTHIDWYLNYPGNVDALHTVDYVQDELQINEAVAIYDKATTGTPGIPTRDGYTFKG